MAVWDNGTDTPPQGPTTVPNRAPSATARATSQRRCTLFFAFGPLRVKRIKKKKKRPVAVMGLWETDGKRFWTLAKRTS